MVEGLLIGLGVAALLGIARGIWRWMRRPRLALTVAHEWSDLRLALTNAGRASTARGVQILVESWHGPAQLQHRATPGGPLRWRRNHETEQAIHPGQTKLADFLYFMPKNRAAREPYELDAAKHHPGSARLLLTGGSREVRFFGRDEGTPGPADALGDSRTVEFQVSVTGEPPLRPSRYLAVVSYYGGAPFGPEEEASAAGDPTLAERTSTRIEAQD